MEFCPFDSRAPVCPVLCYGMRRTSTQTPRWPHEPRAPRCLASALSPRKWACCDLYRSCLPPTPGCRLSRSLIICLSCAASKEVLPKFVQGKISKLPSNVSVGSRGSGKQNLSGGGRYEWVGITDPPVSPINQDRLTFDGNGMRLCSLLWLAQ